MSKDAIAIYYLAAAVVVGAIIVVGFVRAHNAWKRHMRDRHADFLRRYARQVGRR